MRASNGKILIKGKWKRAEAAQRTLFELGYSWPGIGQKYRPATKNGKKMWGLQFTLFNTTVGGKTTTIKSLAWTSSKTVYRYYTGTEVDTNCQYYPERFKSRGG